MLASEGQKAVLEKLHLDRGEPWVFCCQTTQWGSGCDLATMKVRYSPDGKYLLREKYRADTDFSS